MRKLWSPGSSMPDRVELIEPSPHGGKPEFSAPAYPPAAATYNNGITSIDVSQPDGSSDGTYHNTPRSERSRVLQGGRNSKGLTRFGLPKGSSMLYIDDLYHTLLNMPRYRFLASFFTVYLTLYLVFSFMYLTIPEDCIGGDMTFGHAFWFSVWTASTIGYSSYLAPSPDCAGINILVTFQIIVAALIDTMLMSLVFSRFAAPMPRARTIRFSHNAVLARQRGSPYWALTFRMANIRKHSLMDPEVELLLAVPDSTAGSSTTFKFVPLVIDDLLTQITSLKLGLPATVSHTITPSSPMFELSLASMEQHGMDLLCFMSGLDPMTSNMLQAHHPYRPADVRMNERFVGIRVATNKKGKLGVDLSVFDATVAAEVGMGFRDESQAVLYPVPMDDGQGPDGVRQHMQELRTRTLRSLSDPVLERPGDTDTDTGDRTPVAGQTGQLEAAPSKLWLPALATQSWHPLGGSASHSGAAPPLPVSRAPLEGAGSLRGTAPAPPLTRAGQWDDAVRALCEAVGEDPGAAPDVRQRAAALRAALLAVPAAPQSGGGAAGPATANGGFKPNAPLFDMLQ